MQQRKLLKMMRITHRHHVRGSLLALTDSGSLQGACALGYLADIHREDHPRHSWNVLRLRKPMRMKDALTDE